MPSILITGANRGLGLEFVEQYHRDGWRVFACCRRPGDAQALSKIASASGGGVSVHRLDVADHGTVDALASELSGEAIDVLLNNAGVMGERAPLESLDYDDWERTLRINTLGPIKVAAAFLPHVRRGARKVIATVTSKMGSIADNTSGNAYAYRSSKAALNMANMSLARDLSDVTCVVLHPGWVKTDMGGASAPIEAPESVSGMREVIAGLKPSQSGAFYDYTGAELPW